MRVIKMDNEGMFAVVCDNDNVHMFVVYNEYYAPVAIISYDHQTVFMLKHDVYDESVIFSKLENIVYGWKVEIVDHRTFTDMLDLI